ncbi:MAG TPA: hypothetical protein VKT26_03405 [Acetobacteraceae bacterium]|nr:hypothetical protein [Acetobacteraceae bacterium]
MALFSAVTAEDMQTARIVTGVAMALFIGAGVVPGMRQRAVSIRWVLLGVYLVACVAFVGYVLLK